MGLDPGRTVANVRLRRHVNLDIAAARILYICVDLAKFPASTVGAVLPHDFCQCFDDDLSQGRQTWHGSKLLTKVVHACERGTTVTISTGRQIPVRWIGEQHVREDLDFIPSLDGSMALRLLQCRLI